MRILTVYNKYRVHGGEDEVFLRETQALQAAGHDVVSHTADNATLDDKARLRLATKTIWNTASARAMTALVGNTRADVVHVHNFFAALSPTILRAAHNAGAAVVLTLHNFRLFCGNSMLLRDDRPCERCVGLPLAWPGILHGCYRGSVGQSAVVSAMSAVHRLAGTWDNHVDRYITLTENSRRICVAGGLAASKIAVKANFTEDQHVAGTLDGPRQGALFVGKLTDDKGLGVIVQAWEGSSVPLRILGVGAWQERLKTAGFHADGQQPQTVVAEAMRRAEVLIVPSLWYETFGLVVIEAFAAGLPVVASNHGALADLIEDGVTGLLIRPNDAEDLRAKVAWAVAHPEAMRQMGRQARQRYLERYTPAANLPQLEAIYAAAIAARSSGGSRR
jgi:glycosyltransferase involved in cell wall biosynthesis